MKKIVLSLFVVLMMMTLSLQSQVAGNLVLNPSFESSFAMPDREGDIANAVGWDNLNGGTNYPNATPDYFHTSGVGDAQLPNTYAGTVPTLDGNAVAGFITYNFFVPNYREYLGINLNQTMIPGENYTISFWLCNSVSNHYASMGSNNIGVKLFTGAPTQNVNAPLLITPDAEITAITHLSTWTQYSFTYTASAAHDYIVIGNFRDDANTQRQSFTSGYGMAYYFIDMVSVQEVSPLAIDGVDLARGSNADAINLQWNMPEDKMAGEWYLERSFDQNTFTTMAAYNENNGSLQAGWMDYTDESAAPNLAYYYRLRHVGVDGEVELSNLVLASYEGEKNYAAGEVFPNPVQDQFGIRFAASEAADLSLTVLDQSGKEIFQDVQSLEVGEHVVGYQLDGELASGIYFANFTYQGETFTRRIVSAK